MLRTTAAVAACATALLAAVSAHIGIDVLGDFLVRDDTYDHVAHGSRELFTLVALALAAAAALFLFSHLCGVAASFSQRVRLLQVRRTHVVAATGCAVILTLLLVPTMETIDAVRAGGDIESLADAFGGSLLLGICTTIACAFLWSGLVIGVVVWLAHHRDRVARLLAAFFRFRGTHSLCNRERRAPAAFLASAPARRARHHSKRGPPPAAALVLIH